ncbi:SARP family transcriptional regulator [Longispora fulva]|uniref:DNA-binding SARP family transcriptional activator/Tfp pilus assembly protein PilF n=1 Tax=Longispora fulva TaxID=619741 RepID=A0A8J7GAM5_9ACTN|nr:tetratricopeptide repeat protein [Longispora fulva]MBG6134859.1 DNA-binding SARP family transcriptional activator/Tfp pilus assembly protein PilF [Longispora fulva]GIG56909.1 SARP family transcriptional regulator [Longispora fulva]
MWVGLLGPVEVRHDGVALPLGSAMQRTVLALLALDAGRVVSVDRLVDGLWAEAPPERTSGLIQTYISRLRAAFRPAGVDIRRSGNGYVLEIPPADVDARAFQSAVAAALAAADPAPLRAALALWRGDPLGDLRSTPLVDRIRAGLAEEHLTAVEECLDRELRAGRHREIVGELARLHAEHPLRERFLSLLLLALFRDGRQSEALQRYEDARRHLADELGLDPTPELADLHGRILRNDPGLNPAPPVAVRVPRLLPYDVRDFTGRVAELAYLMTLAEGVAHTVVISAIDGMPGIGKTAMAVHIAHALADRFPDGQLFVDLHGYTPGRTPVDSAAALRLLLRALGVAEHQLPADPDERAALWRDQLAGRRVLILLDNAADAAQVRPLLPGTPGSLVLITSRRRLTTLDGAESLLLEVLPAEDAHALFVAVAGDAVLAEPDAVAEVLRLCGYLPLAVRIAAARIGLRRHRPVERLAQLLGAEHQRLAELSLDDRDVTAAFNLSYDALPADQRWLFRLLGLHPGADFEPHSVAALAGRTPDAAERLLERLADAHLLLRGTGDRYTFHDLLRVYAADRAADLAPADRDAALARLFDHYLATAGAAVGLTGLVMPPGRYPAPVVGHPTPVEFGTKDEALAWLTAERAGLIAAAELAPAAGHPRFGYDLATTTMRYLDAHAHYADALALYGHALRGAEDAADRAGQADLLRFTGQIHFRRASYDVAAEHVGRAMLLHRAEGDQAGEAGALDVLGMIHGHRGELDQALICLQQALDLHRATGYRVGETVALSTIGGIYGRLGDYRRAGDHFRQALAGSHDVGNREIEGTALANLATVYQRLGRYEEALDHCRRALAVTRETGNRRGEANALANLGLIYGRLDRPALALDHYEQSRRLHREIGHRSSEGYTLTGVGDIHHRAGDHDLALEHHRRALDLSRELGDRNLEAHALNGLGAASLALGSADQALVWHTRAEAVSLDTGDAYSQARAVEGLGHAHHARGAITSAVTCWEHALLMYARLGVAEEGTLREHLEGFASRDAMVRPTPTV